MTTLVSALGPRAAAAAMEAHLDAAEAALARPAAMAGSASSPEACSRGARRRREPPLARADPHCRQRPPRLRGPDGAARRRPGGLPGRDLRPAGSQRRRQDDPDPRGLRAAEAGMAGACASPASIPSPTARRGSAGPRAAGARPLRPPYRRREPGGLRPPVGPEGPAAERRGRPAPWPSPTSPSAPARRFATSPAASSGG